MPSAILSALSVVFVSFFGLLEAIDDRQQIAQKFLHRKFVGVFDVALRASPHIFHLGNGSQELIFDLGELFA